MSKRRLSATDLPQLAALMMSYFHQDWLVYGSAEAAIDHALAVYSRQERNLILHDVNKLIQWAEDDSDIKAVLHRMPHAEIGFRNSRGAGEFIHVLREKILNTMAKQ